MSPQKAVVRHSNPPGVFQSPLYHNVGTIEGRARLVYTAGQIGRDSNGVTPESYVEQVKLALRNLDLCLRAEGATAGDIVKLTYFIVNYDATARAHAEPVYEFLGSHRPPTTLIPVTALALPGVLFEIEAVAAVKHDVPSLTAMSLTGKVPEVDVVVVGGGLSGLQAAHDIQKAGHSCVVLEARDRVGGKTWSLPTADGKGVVDVGAAWINDTNQSKMYALSQRFGLELIEQNSTGNAVMQGTGIFEYGTLPNVSWVL